MDQRANRITGTRLYKDPVFPLTPELFVTRLWLVSAFIKVPPLPYSLSLFLTILWVGNVRWTRLRAQTNWTTWPQPILCLSAFQWHSRRIGSKPENDTNGVQYIMSGVASVVDSDGRRLTCGSVL
uniref:Transmembrane protein n=1 Tax=Mesocestoides corti TaxID=53468 RepID=A0A5K3FYS0_MESCO